MMRNGTLTLLKTLLLTTLLAVSLGVVPASAVDCCMPCHGTFETEHPNIDHNAILGTGEVLVFNNANFDHGAGFSVEENCTLCHYANLITQHGGNCALCHTGTNPAGALGGNWDKSCSQGSCHPSIHNEMRDDHNGMYWNSSASCSLCHDGIGDFPGAADCYGCHNPDLTAAAVGDHLPPSTTSNAQSSYIGSSSIQLNAIDAGTSGVSLTWYSLDYRQWNLGNNIYFSAPTSGSRSYNLRFYSTDHAMNVEPVQSVAFTVQSAVTDTTPPTTTSSFNPPADAALKTSQAVTLTASDSGSGVKATYYKIDSGNFVQGTTFTVSSDGLHNFSYYSVDNANITESTHVSNTFRIDTVAPATTCSAVDDSTYVGPQTFTLAATDTDGSGVASTWYQLDTGAWVAGSSVSVPAPSSGTASHTISWYSLDVATNVEETKDATFTVQSLASDTTPPTTTSSFNPPAGAAYKTSQPVTLTATDSGSGVQATYYKIDTGTFVQGTTFTISGDGLHSFSYYSVDNANLPETVNGSNTFRIDTIAPVTTCDAVNDTTYVGAQTFTLAPTDTGSGVAGTWYRIDSGAWVAGSSVSVPAPGAGSTSYTISWYSQDVAENQETTKSVTVTVTAASAGTTAIAFRTSCSGISDWVYWEVRDANGVPIDGMSFSNDDCGHALRGDMWADFNVPSGVGYELYGEFSDYEGNILDSAIRTVSPSEAAPGAIIEWWFH